MWIVALIIQNEQWDSRDVVHQKLQYEIPMKWIFLRFRTSDNLLWNNFLFWTSFDFNDIFPRSTVFHLEHRATLLNGCSRNRGKFWATKLIKRTFLELKRTSVQFKRAYFCPVTTIRTFSTMNQKRKSSVFWGAKYIFVSFLKISRRFFIFRKNFVREYSSFTSKRFFIFGIVTKIHFSPKIGLFNIPIHHWERLDWRVWARLNCTVAFFNLKEVLSWSNKEDTTDDLKTTWWFITFLWVVSPQGTISARNWCGSLKVVVELTVLQCLGEPLSFA